MIQNGHIGQVLGPFNANEDLLSSEGAIGSFTPEVERPIIYKLGIQATTGTVVNINDTLINFEKIENVQIAIDKFFNFKNAKDKINPVIPDELWFLENLEDLKETELEALADKLEPEFKLYANKKREKRLTNIDRIYFSENNIKKPNTKDIKNSVKK